MNWKEKRVLITGGGGFLGRYIVEELLSLGCKSIKSLGRSSKPELTEKGVNVVCGDVRNRDFVIDAAKNCDIIFHTAAKADIWGKYRDFYNTNVKGTANVIVACEANKIPILINTSSPSVVSSEDNLENVDEAIPIPEKFLTHYPSTKAVAEKLVAQAVSGEFRTISLRPHLIWGPRDPHILPRLFQRAASKRLIRIGDGDNKVDLTYVENAAHAHIQAAETLAMKPEISGKSYFISDDSPVLLWPWIDEMLKKMNLPAISRNMSYKKARRIGVCLEIIHKILCLPGEPLMTRFVAAQLGHSHFFNISAAKADLGYSPIIPNEKAMEKTIEYFMLVRNN
jgi:2-alkyl-3-oxoalkanoate reductase